MLHLDGLVANNYIVEILKQNMTGYLFYCYISVCTM